jgi:hypothetical protein
MPGGWWDDDAALVAKLDEAWSAAQQVPPEFIAAGKAVWTPRDIDAELAELIYDSEREPVAVRTDTAALRALTFASPAQTIELEVGDAALMGQLVPPCCAEIEVEVRDGTAMSATADEFGIFTVGCVPTAAFRLRCRTITGLDLLTNWIAI